MTPQWNAQPSSPVPGLQSRWNFAVVMNQQMYQQTRTPRWVVMQSKLVKKCNRNFGDEKQEQHLVVLYLKYSKSNHSSADHLSELRHARLRNWEISICLKHMATSVILVHNHPSGAVAPSRNDDHVTKLVKEALSWWVSFSWPPDCSQGIPITLVTAKRQIWFL